MKKIRSSNLEVLRIISMLMIVLHHAVLHGVLHSEETYDLSFFKDHIANFTILNILFFGGKVSVAIFIMITGYFSTKVNFSIRRIIPIEMQTFFYSMLGLVIGIFFIKNISLFLVFKQFFPVIYTQYWFISNYIFIILFSPFIILALKSMNKNQHLFLLVLLVLTNSVFPSFMPKSLDSITNEFFSFILFFVTGYFINIYGSQFRLSKNKGIFLIFLSVALYIASVVLIEFLMLILNKNVTEKIHYFANLNSPLIFLCATGFILVFKNLEMKNNIFINSILDLGQYLRHIFVETVKPF